MRALLTPLRKIILQAFHYDIIDLAPKLLHLFSIPLSRPPVVEDWLPCDNFRSFGLFPDWVSVPDVNIIEDFFADDGDIECLKGNSISLITPVKVALTSQELEIFL